MLVCVGACADELLGPWCHPVILLACVDVPPFSFCAASPPSASAAPAAVPRARQRAAADLLDPGHLAVAGGRDASGRHRVQHRAPRRRECRRDRERPVRAAAAGSGCSRHRGCPRPRRLAARAADAANRRDRGRLQPRQVARRAPPHDPGAPSRQPAHADAARLGARHARLRPVRDRQEALRDQRRAAHSRRRRGAVQGGRRPGLNAGLPGGAPAGRLARAHRDGSARRRPHPLPRRRARARRGGLVRRLPRQGLGRHDHPPAVCHRRAATPRHHHAAHRRHGPRHDAQPHRLCATRVHRAGARRPPLPAHAAGTAQRPLLHVRHAEARPAGPGDAARKAAAHAAARRVQALLPGHARR